MRTRFKTGGEVGNLMCELDWNQTVFGEPEDWSVQLKTLISILLGSNQPMFIAWGPTKAMLYNDAYSVILGKNHPSALGQSMEIVWAEIWDVIRPIMDKAYAGEGTHMDNLMLNMHRNGYHEETYFAFSYTPIRDFNGNIPGMFCACTETTSQVRLQKVISEEAARTRQLFDKTPGFIAILTGPDFRYEFANHAYEALVGFDRVEIGEKVSTVLPEIADQGYMELLQHVLTTGESRELRQTAVMLKRYPDLPLMEIYINVIFQPIRDNHNVVTGIFMEGSDVTDRVRVERELRESENLHRQILDSATDHAIIATDLNGYVTRWNSGAVNILGWSEDEMVGQSMDVFFTPEDVAVDRAKCERDTATLDLKAKDERWHLRKDGERFWAVGELTPLMDDEHHLVGFVKVLSDRTEQRRFSDQQRLLMDELNHRVKNTLATVQSMASQTFKGAHRDEAAKNTFEGRLFALAKAHDVLMRESWSGADLREVVAGALAPYRNSEHDSFTVSGCKLVLSPRKALALTMALHEMATNAVKYGALSTRDGAVLIRWTVDGDFLNLKWQEVNGPVVEPPSRQGFGTRLIRRTLAMELEGEISVEYAPTGFVCTAKIPHTPEVAGIFDQTQLKVY